ncbi:MAG: hypothetical protein UU47_C0006G0003 [candidate division TM6 bacterium GW2011_GWE2_41_16]|nr:MAG: hypothetical protein UU47_C0006G0003 [candidate division TM6 bacterium GW2011_GWE2_41_16]
MLTVILVCAEVSGHAYGMEQPAPPRPVFPMKSKTSKNSFEVIPPVSVPTPQEIARDILTYQKENIDMLLGSIAEQLITYDPQNENDINTLKETKRNLETTLNSLYETILQFSRALNSEFPTINFCKHAKIITTGVLQATNTADLIAIVDLHKELLEAAAFACQLPVQIQTTFTSFQNSVELLKKQTNAQLKTIEQEIKKLKKEKNPSQQQITANETALTNLLNDLKQNYKATKQTLKQTLVDQGWYIAPIFETFLDKPLELPANFKLNPTISESVQELLDLTNRETLCIHIFIQQHCLSHQRADLILPLFPNKADAQCPAPEGFGMRFLNKTIDGFTRDARYKLFKQTQNIMGMSLQVAAASFTNMKMLLKQQSQNLEDICIRTAISPLQATIQKQEGLLHKHIDQFIKYCETIPDQVNERLDAPEYANLGFVTKRTSKKVLKTIKENTRMSSTKICADMMEKQLQPLLEKLDTIQQKMAGTLENQASAQHISKIREQIDAVIDQSCEALQKNILENVRIQAYGLLADLYPNLFLNKNERAIFVTTMGFEWSTEMVQHTEQIIISRTQKAKSLLEHQQRKEQEKLATFTTNVQEETSASITLHEECNQELRKLHQEIDQAQKEKQKVSEQIDENKEGNITAECKKLESTFTPYKKVLFLFPIALAYHWLFNTDSWRNWTRLQALKNQKTALIDKDRRLQNFIATRTDLKINVQTRQSCGAKLAQQTIATQSFLQQKSQERLNQIIRRLALAIAKTQNLIDRQTETRTCAIRTKCSSVRQFI